MGWEAYIAKYPDFKILIRHQNLEIWRKEHMESNGKFTLIVFNTCTQEYRGSHSDRGGPIALTAEPGGISRTMIRAF